MATDADGMKQAGAPEARLDAGATIARPIRMLVPVDWTELGEAVLETAVRTARLLHAEVHLITVLAPEHERVTLDPLAASDSGSGGVVWSPMGGPQPVAVEGADQALAAERSASDDFLHHAAERFGGLPVTINVVRRKSAAEAIVDYARGCNIDLIAMGTHGRRPLAQALLGSVVAEVIHSGVAPVIVVKPKEN
jgi:nucleotide-binding universal stress UspA family protein